MLIHRRHDRLRQFREIAAIMVDSHLVGNTDYLPVGSFSPRHRDTLIRKLKNVEEEKRNGEDQRKREEAALKAVDVERLLPGENPSSSFVEDCRHWLRVYNELLQLKHSIIQSTREINAEADPAVRIESEETDLVIMRAEADRFERRVAFWEKRLAQLERAEASRPA
jgi:hypothetical protein